MTQYLILHKVRGEPSFDCAEPVCSGNGEPCQPECGNWRGGKCLAADEWVTNSGYRAYPYMKWPIDQLRAELSDVELPTDWPDHFEVRVEKKTELNLGKLLSNLLPKVHRRF